VSLPIPKLISETVNLLNKLPGGVLGHVYDFTTALVNGDKEAAKRAATSAITERIFNAPIKR
jgi:hypothetical protein